MVILSCPECGPRNVQEFRFGGEYNPRPGEPMATSDQTWQSYLFMRHNRSGVQKEWWYHRSGCGIWFLAERHTKSNEVMKTYRWSVQE